MAKKKIEFADGVPEHTTNFLRATHDLVCLLNAHSHHLLSEEPEKEVVPDAETVFSRAAVTLQCAAWEAFVEDLARNSLKFLLGNCVSPSDVPDPLRRIVSKAIKDDPHEMAVWKIAGDEWKGYMLQRYDLLVQKVLRLNTPDGERIKTLYRDTLGIEDITECWHWDAWTPEFVRTIVSQFIELRGDIAHGRKRETPLSSAWLLYLCQVIGQCTVEMNNHMQDWLKTITGKHPWSWIKRKIDWDKFKVVASPTDTTER
jgi:hypothetical protein